MDGTRDIGTLRTGFELRTGTPLSPTNLEQLLSALDQALFLDNERFTQAYVAAVSDYRCAACRPHTLPGRSCPSDPQELSTYLQQYLDEVPDANPCPGLEIRGLISPHIDFPRGGPVYASVWAKAATAVREAELIVILGTDHMAASGEVTLTRQNYQTPWGTIPTAQDMADEVAREVGDEVFRYELHHRGEHSVETAALWLHHLVRDKPCPILPVLCGSFQPFIDRGESPLRATLISDTVAALKRVAALRRTVVIAAADFAHVGPAFGDRAPLDAVDRARLTAHDQTLIDILSGAEAEHFFEAIRSEGDQMRICGLPPIYLMLSVLTQVKGVSTGYAQCPASEDGGSLVSICGMTYHSEAA